MKSRDLKILEAAIEIENDGRNFYLKSAELAKNAFAKKLLISLADEELKHIDRIMEICEGLKEDRDWVDFDKKITKQIKAKLKLIFKPLSSSERKRLKMDPSDLRAFNMAMKKEKASYDFYEKQERTTKIPIAKKFYNRLKIEEERHYELLDEARFYLSDTASWFVKQEGRVVEGG
ncbi:MAG: ferritin family protein [Candidatus Omnitrophota bacterium]